MVEPHDDDGHVVAAVLAEALDRLGATLVQDLLAEVREHDLVSARGCGALQKN